MEICSLQQAAELRNLLIPWNIVKTLTIFIKKSGARSGAQVFYNTFTIKSETQITKLAFFFSKSNQSDVKS